MEIKKLNKMNKGSWYILIPKTIIKKLSLKDGDYFIISVLNGDIILEKVDDNGRNIN